MSPTLLKINFGWFLAQQEKPKSSHWQDSGDFVSRECLLLFRDRVQHLTPALCLGGHVPLINIIIFRNKEAPRDVWDAYVSRHSVLAGCMIESILWKLPFHYILHCHYDFFPHMIRFYSSLRVVSEQKTTLRLFNQLCLRKVSVEDWDREVRRGHFVPARFFSLKRIWM